MKISFEIGDILQAESKGIDGLPEGLKQSYRIFLGFTEGCTEWRWCWPEKPHEIYISEAESLAHWHVYAQKGNIHCLAHSISFRDCIIISKTGKLISNKFLVNYETDGPQTRFDDVEYIIGAGFWAGLALCFRIFKMMLKNRREFEEVDLSKCLT